MSFLTISQLSEEDRPREKLLAKGRQQLSNAELLAILLGSGYKDKNALTLAQEVLRFFNNDLSLLARQGVADLVKFKGIGQAKAITIITALELSRRREVKLEKQVIKTSDTAYQCLKPVLSDLDHEQFWILILNRANKVLNKVRLSSGGRSGTVVDAKMLFKVALDEKASSVIVAHNHPSGNIKPSQADILLTKRLCKAGQLLEIPVLDHLIYTDNGYFSFADEGMLNES